MRRYKQFDEDSARWDGFVFRDDDIVIVSPSKSGTTWTQLMVALLVFDGPEFPEPIGKMSPWMEHRVESVSEIHGVLERQTHRRFIKTHTPLDGVPMDDRVSYVCVGRDPRDAAVSMRKHVRNMDRDRRTELVREQIGTDESIPPTRAAISDGEYFDAFIDGGSSWSVAGLAHHYTTVWAERHRPNVALFHFDDYLRDLPAEFVRLGAYLGIALDDSRAAALASEASIERARARAPDVLPEGHLDFWHEPAQFFATGTSGQWREVMTADQNERYLRRMSSLLDPDLMEWVHHGRTAERPDVVRL
ncbi:MAG: sulfotransferase domain-containing protein [Acidimicrobiia bacterium]|nr:sulfotransferase domain-containing protein [Acidimicrobiia bacterium]NNF63357.1 sulfotransferase domain-containing protein [Acidimicrobiia bacterium]